MDGGARVTPSPGNSGPHPTGKASPCPQGWEETTALTLPINVHSFPGDLQAPASEPHHPPRGQLDGVVSRDRAVHLYTFSTSARLVPPPVVHSASPGQG